MTLDFGAKFSSPDHTLTAGQADASATLLLHTGIILPTISILSVMCSQRAKCMYLIVKCTVLHSAESAEGHENIVDH